MITFVTDDSSKENGSEEPVIGVTQAGTPVDKIVEAAEKAAEEESKKTEEADKAEITETPEAQNGSGNTEAEEKISKLMEEFSINEHKALFHKGNLRNGADLEFDGSIILLGDVNPGAQIKATGNILILGSLKGVAHAGSKGEKKAFVFALNLVPVQLRIADIITRFPDGDSKEGRKPEYAYVEDGKIYVSAFS